MILINLINDIGKAIVVIFAFFLISGTCFLLKPDEDDKYMAQQLKMYPLGFHCIDDDSGDEKVIKVDMKSQIAIYRDVYKYTMTRALYLEGKKDPIGCELILSGNGVERGVMIYVDDSPINLEQVCYEKSEDKDLIYKVVAKSIKKNQGNIRFRNVEYL